MAKRAANAVHGPLLDVISGRFLSQNKATIKREHSARLENAWMNLAAQRPFFSSLFPSFSSFQKYLVWSINMPALHHLIADHLPTEHLKARLGWQDTNTCDSCQQVGDTQHLFFSCTKYDKQREQLMLALNLPLHPQQVQDLFVHQSADSLKAINEYLQTTIYSKSAGLTY
jgi:hypothetical protein